MWFQDPVSSISLKERKEGKILEKISTQSEGMFQKLKNFTKYFLKEEFLKNCPIL